MYGRKASLWRFNQDCSAKRDNPDKKNIDPPELLWIGRGPENPTSVKNIDYEI